MDKLLAMPGKLLAWLDGKKTYLAGAAMCCAALAGELTTLTNMHSLMDLLALVRAGASDPNVAMFLQGIAVMTGRAAISKMAPAPEA